MKHNLAITAWVLLLILMASHDAQSQWVDAGGPHDTINVDLYSGAIKCFAVNGTNLFAGDAGGGIFRTTNNGLSWLKVNTGLSNKNVRSLMTVAAYIYAGTEGGVYYTPDSGANWIPSNNGLNPKEKVNSLILRGTDIFAGCDGGVYRSTNYGANWDPAGLKDTIIHALFSIGGNLFAGSNYGIFRSDDNGQNWILLDSGLTDLRTVQSIAAIGSIPLIGTGYGVYRLSDKGAFWESANSGFPLRSTPALLVSDTNIFAANYFGVFRSTDHGSNWANYSAGLLSGGVGALIVSSEYLFAGSSSGVWRRPLTDLGKLSVTANTSLNHSFISYPNPFFDRVTIRFASEIASYAQITIVNLIGSEVAKLYSGNLDAGEHSLNWDAHGMPQGMYHCVKKIGSEVKEISLMLVK